MLPFKKDLKLTKSLQQKKFRQETGLFVVEGRKMVEEALQSGFSVHAVYTTDDEFAAKHHAIPVNSKDMQYITSLSEPPGYLAVVKQPINKLPMEWPDKVLLLDGISDPGNMGTIVRTADWFGIRAIVCSESCVEMVNPKVVQATMGSIFRVKWYKTELLPLMKSLEKQGYETVGADLNGDAANEFIFPEKTALVIGSEAHGISDAVRKTLICQVKIDGAPGAESLNAGIAAGILMNLWFNSKP